MTSWLTQKWKTIIWWIMCDHTWSLSLWPNCFEGHLAHEITGIKTIRKKGSQHWVPGDTIGPWRRWICWSHWMERLRGGVVLSPTQHGIPAQRWVIFVHVNVGKRAIHREFSMLLYSGSGGKMIPKNQSVVMMFLCTRASSYVKLLVDHQPVTTSQHCHHPFLGQKLSINPGITVEPMLMSCVLHSWFSYWTYPWFS